MKIINRIKRLLYNESLICHYEKLIKVQNEELSELNSLKHSIFNNELFINYLRSNAPIKEGKYYLIGDRYIYVKNVNISWSGSLLVLRGVVLRECDTYPSYTHNIDSVINLGEEAFGTIDFFGGERWRELSKEEFDEYKEYHQNRCLERTSSTYYPF